MHSSIGNVQKLRHDLRNGPARVFGDHRQCNSQFCRNTEVDNTTSEDNESDATAIQIPEPSNFQEQIEAIILEENEIAAEPNAEEMDDARRGSRLCSVPEALFAKVMACGDRLVMLAPKLITNQTSNLAECYMSIRCCFDGGKQYNRVQRGSFEARCYGAGLRVQNGPTWAAEFWEKTAGEKPGEVY